MDTGEGRQRPKVRPIELKVREVGQLFHNLDPLPFRERDLDAAVEDYVVAWARELPSRPPLEIVIHIPEAQLRSEGGAQIAPAVSNYFAYRADQITRELSELFRFGRTALAIGLSVLAACVLTGAAAARMFDDVYLGRFFQEGLFILGWVANWRPVEVFLYDWWPLARRRRLYRRLAAASVRIAPS